MSKLASKDKFLDFSDYGRFAGNQIANALKNTRFTPIHVTLLFGYQDLLLFIAFCQIIIIWLVFSLY